MFVLVANSLDRTPGELEDASSILGGGRWYTARRVTIPLVLPALLAGALVAFLQAMTLFGSPAILALPAGFHTMTTKIWSLFQFPPKPELAAAAVAAAAGADRHPAARRAHDPRAARLLGCRRQIRRAATDSAAPLALARSRLVPLRAAHPGVSALCGAVQRGVLAVATTFLTFNNFTLHNIHFVLFELSAASLALKNTVILGTATATIGTAFALVIAYVTARQAVTGWRVLGFLATAPIAIPGIVLGVGLFLSYTRPPFVLYGTLWILLIAFVTIALALRLSAAAGGISHHPSRA